MPDAPTIVSLTPTAIESDTRAWKIACSFARLGYESIVVEGVRSESRERFNLPIISLSDGAPISPPTSGEPGLRARLRGGLGIDSLDSVIATLYKIRYQWRHGWQPLRQIPPAACYYLHGFNLGPATIRAAQRLGVPFVYDSHDLYSGLQQDAELTAFQATRIKPYLLDLERDCWREAAEVVTVSDGLAEIMQTRFGRRPVVLRNAHDPGIELVPDRDVRDLAAVGPDDFLVVVVGNSKPGQAVDSLLRALRDLPEHLHVALVGKGYEAYRPLVESLGVSRRVHFPGAVPAPTVVPFIRSADAAILLYYPLADNWTHCLPNGFFQSIAAGLPLLYPGDLPEIASISRTHSLALDIDPRNPASIAGAISRLIASPESRNEQAAAARAAAAKLTWEKEHRLLEGLMSRILPPHDQAA